jgi:homoserine kinase
MSDGASAVAHARAALAGNPSDGYGGAVLAMTLDHFSAEAHASRSPAGVAIPSSDLVSATVARFERELEPAAAATAVRWGTSIPRAVGLGGSSAIVIATLRALCNLYEVTLDPAQLAEFALAVETDELGIAAGPQDRVVQSFGGLTFMDFANPPRYESLDRGLLPPLAVAWLPDAAAASSDVHGELRVRANRVRPAMAELADVAGGGGGRAGGRRAPRARRAAEP